MESAPFKLTAEMVALMGGASSEGLEYSRACHPTGVLALITVIRTQLHSSVPLIAATRTLQRLFVPNCTHPHLVALP